MHLTSPIAVNFLSKDHKIEDDVATWQHLRVRTCTHLYVYTGHMQYTVKFSSLYLCG